VQAEVQKATSKLQQEFAAQLKEATGHESLDALKTQKLADEGRLQELLDDKTKEADAYKNQFQQTQIDNSLLSASADALDADVIRGLLASKAVVDAGGNVTIDGKTVKDAVADLLKAKPFLAKASGNTGSSTQQSTITPPPSTTANLSPVERLNAARSQGAK
jgi:hypothetical protein